MFHVKPPGRPHPRSRRAARGHPVRCLCGPGGTGSWWGGPREPHRPPSLAHAAIALSSTTVRRRWRSAGAGPPAQRRGADGCRDRRGGPGQPPLPHVDRAAGGDGREEDVGQGLDLVAPFADEAMFRLFRNEWGTEPALSRPSIHRWGQVPRDRDCSSTARTRKPLAVTERTGLAAKMLGLPGVVAHARSALFGPGLRWLARSATGAGRWPR